MDGSIQTAELEHMQKLDKKFHKIMFIYKNFQNLRELQNKALFCMKKGNIFVNRDMLDIDLFNFEKCINHQLNLEIRNLNVLNSLSFFDLEKIHNLEKKLKIGDV